MDEIDRFDAEFAENYDRGVRLAVPGYETLHDVAHAVLRSRPGNPGDRARVLIAGAGTGAEILTLGEREPGWSFVGADPSEEMNSSQRLRTLREEGLVVGRREGKHVYYALSDRHVATLILNVLTHATEPENAGSKEDHGEERTMTDRTHGGHGHVHGEDCGHEPVPHGDHTDYLVDGHLHHPHGDHCDDHGPVEVA